MRRGWILPALAAGLVLAMPGVALGAPQAKLTAAQADGKVTFDASKSSDPGGQIVAYEWDLDGDGAYEANTAAGEPTATAEYLPGTTLIAGVRVTDAAGGRAEDTVVVRIAQAQAPATEPVAEVRAAASGSITIMDFHFVPSSVTIGVGDTVTWTNQGPTSHTASANGGEFDSGLLAKGKSFSHKFIKAGTYTFFCKPHPFMTGKVVVTGGSSGGGSGGSGGSSGPGSSGSSGAPNAGTSPGSGAAAGSGASAGGLPNTGSDVPAWATLGAALLVFGAALRWRLTAP